MTIDELNNVLTFLQSKGLGSHQIVLDEGDRYTKLEFEESTDYIAYLMFSNSPNSLMVNINLNMYDIEDDEVLALPIRRFQK